MPYYLQVPPASETRDIRFISLTSHGKPYYESSKSHRETNAKTLLKKREGEISQSKLPGICFEWVRFEELANDFLTEL